MANVLLAFHNNVTTMMVKDVCAKELPSSHVYTCNGADVVNTYKRLCQEGSKPTFIMTDDQSLEYARQLQNFDPMVKYIWVVSYATSEGNIIQGIRNGVIDFLHFPFKTEELIRFVRTYGQDNSI